jgi:tRNA pseudouridine38-40 synthase
VTTTDDDHPPHDTRKPETPSGTGVGLVVEYDGTAFCGYQYQENQRSVQGDLERAIGLVQQTAVRVRGASRTDAGVHAKGQIVAFDAVKSLPVHRWAQAINSYLKPDIAVREAFECVTGYSPRHESTRKRYQYLCQLGDVPLPLWRTRAWFVRTTGRPFVSLHTMHEAAQTFVGQHDFHAFCAAHHNHKTSVRTLYEMGVRWYDERDLVVAIEVEGNAFLKHMVRILAGTLVEVGLGKRSGSDLSRLLGPDAHRAHAGRTAPAHGLTLERVDLGRRLPAPPLCSQRS